MEFKSNGARRSPPDVRDCIADRIYGRTRGDDIPESLDLRPELEHVRDQGNQGSCVALSAACVKEWQERKNDKIVGYMSAQFLYNNRSNHPEEGMYGRDIMSILLNKGCCREYLYRYQRIEGIDSIPSEAYEQAAKYKIKSYARAESIFAVKQSLVYDGPSIILLPCYNYSPNFWIKQDEDEDNEYGHAVTIVGFTSEGFILRNSWGPDWNNDGYTVFPYEDFGTQYEIWTSIDDILYEVGSPPNSETCCNIL